MGRLLPMANRHKPAINGRSSTPLRGHLNVGFTQTADLRPQITGVTSSAIAHARTSRTWPVRSHAPTVRFREVRTITPTLCRRSDFGNTRGRLSDVTLRLVSDS